MCEQGTPRSAVIVAVKSFPAPGITKRSSHRSLSSEQHGLPFVGKTSSESKEANRGIFCDGRVTPTSQTQSAKNGTFMVTVSRVLL